MLVCFFAFSYAMRRSSALWSALKTSTSSSGCELRDALVSENYTAGMDAWVVGCMGAQMSEPGIGVSNGAHSYVCMSLCFFIQYLVWRAVVMYGGLPLLGGCRSRGERAYCWCKWAVGDGLLMLVVHKRWVGPHLRLLVFSRRKGRVAGWRAILF